MQFTATALKRHPGHHRLSASGGHSLNAARRALPETRQARDLPERAWSASVPHETILVCFFSFFFITAEHNPLFFRFYFSHPHGVGRPAEYLDFSEVSLLKKDAV